MNIGIEMSKKSNNFLGKEEVGSSNLLAGSIVSRYTKYLSLYIFIQAHLWRTDSLFYNFYSFFALITLSPYLAVLHQDLL